jgi:hypothetical protein
MPFLFEMKYKNNELASIALFILISDPFCALFFEATEKKRMIVNKILCVLYE